MLNYFLFSTLRSEFKDFIQIKIVTYWHLLVIAFMHWWTLSLVGNQFIHWNIWCILCTLRQNRKHPFILFITFNTIGSPDIDSSNTHTRYVACSCCFICISLYLMCLRIFLAPHLLANKIDLVLWSQKCWICFQSLH